MGRRTMSLIRLAVFLTKVGLVLFLADEVIAQEIPVNESFFPVPVGLSAEFEHEDTSTRFTMEVDGDIATVVFDQGNAHVRVEEENMVVWDQPLTFDFPGVGQFSGSLISIFTVSQEDGSLRLIKSEGTFDFGNAGTVMIENTPDTFIPILSTLTDCINEVDRREDYVLTERTVGFDEIEQETFPWFSMISTTPIASFPVGSMMFQDVCSLRVLEPLDVINDPLVLDIGWHLAKGYGVVQMEQEFDNGSQFSRLVSTNITEFWAGGIVVTITPSEAVTAGAQWKVIADLSGTDSGFQNSGDRLDDLPQGVYTVKFSEIADWNTPVSQQITIGVEVLSTSGVYTRQTGSVSVTITPQQAADAGARWRIFNGEFDTGFRTSDTQVDDVPTGEYTLEFQDIIGWVTPDAQIVSVENESLTSPAADYMRLVGGVSVTITPQGAIDGGAQWMIEGLQGDFESGFQESGVTVSDVPVGTYRLRLSEVAGWVALDQAITIVSNDVLQTAVSYAPDTDNDRMDDDWEVANFGSTNPLPHIDQDGDGHNNIQEFRNSTDPLKYAVPLSHGWNLISLSAIPDDNRLAQIFTGVELDPLAWTYASGQAEQVGSLSDSRSAYWVFQRGSSGEAQPNGTLQIDDQLSQFELELKSGWNLFSILRVPDDNSVTSIFNGVDIASPVWKWQNQRFVVTNTIEPLSGYWVHLNGNDVTVPVNLLPGP